MPVRTWKQRTRNGEVWRATFAGRHVDDPVRIVASQRLEAEIRADLEAKVPTPEPPEIFHATPELLGLVYWSPFGWYGATYRNGAAILSEQSPLCETKIKAKELLLASLAWEARNAREDRGRGLFDASVVGALRKHELLLKMDEPPTAASGHNEGG